MPSPAAAKQQAEAESAEQAEFEALPEHPELVRQMARIIAQEHVEP